MPDGVAQIARTSSSVANSPRAAAAFEAAIAVCSPKLPAEQRLQNSTHPLTEGPFWRKLAADRVFEPGEPWLVVHKQQFPKPPSRPDGILPWTDEQAIRRASVEMPTLRPTGLEPDPAAKVDE
jgi:hypothetical protein